MRVQAVLSALLVGVAAAQDVHEHSVHDVLVRLAAGECVPEAELQELMDKVVDTKLCLAPLNSTAYVGSTKYACTPGGEIPLDGHDHGHDHDHDHDHRLLADDHDHDHDHDHGHDHGSPDKVVLVLGDSGPHTCVMMEDDHDHDHSDESASPTAEQIGFTLLAVTLVTLLAASGLIGLVMCGMTELKYMREVTAFAAGVILSLVIVHLMPEAQHMITGAGEWEVGSTFIAGVFVGLVNDVLMCHSSHSAKQKALEKAEQGDAEQGDKPIVKMVDRALVTNIIFGDIFCNLTDGILIATGFLIDNATGWLVTLSICLHELPQEYVDFYVLLDAGLSPKWAVGANLLGAASSILGGGLMLAVGGTLGETGQGYVLAFGSGVLLYAALTQLVPRFTDDMAERSLGRRLLRIFLVALGMVVLGLTLLAHVHPGHNH